MTLDHTPSDTHRDRHPGDDPDHWPLIVAAARRDGVKWRRELWRTLMARAVRASRYREQGWS